MTYTEDEIALAWRGAKWLGAPRGVGLTPFNGCVAAVWALLFDALLDKCDAEGIHYAVRPEGTTIEVRHAGYGTHPNRTIALLLALDAAGLLPKEDA